MRILVRSWHVVLLLATASRAASPPAAHDLPTGYWRGSATFRGANLDFAVHFLRGGDALRATMSSTDLLLLDQPLGSVGYAARRVHFVTPDEHPLRFEGRLEGDSIQGSARVPVVPGVVEAGSDPARGLRFVLRPVPAPPAPPYSTRNIRFESAGARLAGTLFIPSGAARRHAGIVILQGSSSNLREEYRFYADHFARAGLAVLTFDKRGKGESGGDYGAASYDVLAEDGAAAVEFLGAQPEVASKRVGVWGLSQGAFIAPRVAARVPSLTFIVAVSPAGVSIGECATYQDSVRLISGGFSTAEAARVATLNREIITWLETGRGEAALAAGLARDADAPWRRASALPVRLPRGAARSGWYWRGRILDPIPSWRALRVPVLAVFGAADELLPARTSAARIERALEEGKNPDHLVRVFPAANHVLRRLPLLAGDRWDWPRAAPGYMDLVTGWILDHAKE